MATYVRAGAALAATLGVGVADEAQELRNTSNTMTSGADRQGIENPPATRARDLPSIVPLLSLLFLLVVVYVSP